ncbi:interleukin-17C-like [Archocentrus centrarchus]|uniref:interleukin-17C-like n=1 Tax=Archocentrus centrarchus TaxID=63155 RepID=UPI0011E9BECE|nr:interleukin-17C-like [Archocentrus centrarchus]
MDLKQVLIFVLFILPAWTSKMFRCYSDTELKEVANRKLRRHYIQATEPARTPAAGSNYSCPLDLYKTFPLLEQRDRSLSPWRYVTLIKEDHFPSEYVTAQCLCSGCIQLKNNKMIEDDDYNSAPIVQNKVFYKKKLCDDKKTYRLSPVNVEVAVGCTCVRPQSSLEKNTPRPAFA